MRLESIDIIEDQIREVTKLPDVFLGYQKRLMQATSKYSVVICEKSRRIGVTWSIAADAVLTAAAGKAAKGMNVYYMGFNLDMTKEFIETCSVWAKAFSHVASEVEEFVFKDTDEKGNSKDIQAFRIKFDSGFSITALTSRPRSLRGRQGYVIIDEAAFHDDLKELMKAALAFLIWGGKVLVISTHDGVTNPFNEYIQDARAGRNKFHIERIDFDDALSDGLYKRICLTSGKEWSAEGEAEWRTSIIDFYGEGADEELFCVPKLSSGSYLPSLLIESRMVDVPVVRIERSSEYVLEQDYERERDIQDWCDENLKPLLEKLDPRFGHSFGEDFGRSGDLSVFWPLQVQQDTRRHTPFSVELRNIPFKQQRQIAWYIIDRLPRFMAGAFDARGNGQQLAEETAQRYGAGRIFQIMMGPTWYLDAFPKYKAGLEDGMMDLPRDADVLADHRIAVIQNGIPQIPKERTKGADGGKRHGDSLIAGVAAYWASLQNIMEYGYTPVNEQRATSSLQAPPDDDVRGPRGFESGGAW